MRAMSARLTLMTVHAHPDDETITTGGIMAKYAAEGARVVCVTSTRGENGDIFVPELDTPENRARLTELRELELTRALARLGPIDHRYLGYRDSGMMGTAENNDPRAFWQADMDEAIGRLVRLVRQDRPHVMVSYNDFGGYGHPDHIRAALVAKGAFARAGDPAWYPEQLEGPGAIEPWRPLKFYESVFDIERRDEMARLLEERGIRSWWAPAPDETDEQRRERDAYMARMAAATGPRTTRIDVGDFLEVKHAALAEHVTQMAADNPFIALGPEEWRQFAPAEEFTLRESWIVPTRIPEDDLFAGLR
jgi:N-acetyl-1-D-myo-inositol-2-amino-2-deoxy-alpha-D-glucopyranoside deacetylase